MKSNQQKSSSSDSDTSSDSDSNDKRQNANSWVWRILRKSYFCLLLWKLRQIHVYTFIQMQTWLY